MLPDTVFSTLFVLTFSQDKTKYVTVLPILTKYSEQLESAPFPYQPFPNGALLIHSFILLHSP